MRIVWVLICLIACSVTPVTIAQHDAAVTPATADAGLTCAPTGTIGSASYWAADVALATAWCSYYQRCSGPDGFPLQFQTQDQCVAFESQWLCYIWNTWGGCIGYPPNQTWFNVQQCLTTPGEGSDAACSDWPGWSNACDAALEFVPNGRLDQGV